MPSVSPALTTNEYDRARIGTNALNAQLAMALGWLADYLTTLQPNDFGNLGPLVTIIAVQVADIIRRKLRGWTVDDWGASVRNAFINLVTLGVVYGPELSAGFTWGKLGPVIAAFLPHIIDAARRWLTTTKPAYIDNTTPITPSGPIVNPFGAMLLFVLLPALAMAAPPKAVINGRALAVPGDILVLDASESTGEPKHFTWYSEQTAPTGTVLMKPCGEGKKCQVASYKGTWTYMLVVSNADGNDMVRHTVKIGDGTPDNPIPVPVPNPTPNPIPTPTPVPTPTPTPNPTPNPTPTPTPSPVFPAGTFNISNDAYKWAMSVQSANRKAESLALASAMEGVHAEIAAGALRGKAAIALRLKLAVNNTLGTSLAAWKQVFGDPLTVKLSDFNSAGKLESTENWQALLQELIVPLREAGK